VIYITLATLVTVVATVTTLVAITRGTPRTSRERTRSCGRSTVSAPAAAMVTKLVAGVKEV
jgi:hypothetical protein